MEKFNFAEKENYGVEYQRISENSLPTWIFRTIKTQASMQKSDKMFSFGSSSNKLGLDCDFDGINEAILMEKRNLNKRIIKTLVSF